MKHVLLIVLSFAVAMAGCKKKSSGGCTYEKGTTVASLDEEAVVTSYLSANNITNAIELEGSGLYYVIDTLGTGLKPSSMCSYITASYTGQLSNGRVFESSTASFILGNQIIEGWKRTLPLIGIGGTIRLYIPSSLGYGAEGKFDPNIGVYTIPPNSMLIFKIKLLNTIN